VIPRAVRRFVRRFPSVQLSLRSMASAAQLAALEAGDIDVGFVHMPVDRGSLAVEEVQRHPLLAALPTRHRLARLSSVSWRSLEGEPFIGFPRQSAPGAYDAIMTFFRQAGFGPNIVHETDSLLARLRMVGAGLGVSLLPAYAAAFPRSGVVLRPLRRPRPWASIGMVHARRPASPVLGRFIAVVGEAAARRI
jgi:DNA-binding transcriptional LysR family regulator